MNQNDQTTPTRPRRRVSRWRRGIVGAALALGLGVTAFVAPVAVPQAATDPADTPAIVQMLAPELPEAEAESAKSQLKCSKKTRSEYDAAIKKTVYWGTVRCHKKSKKDGRAYIYRVRTKHSLFGSGAFSFYEYGPWVRLSHKKSKGWGPTSSSPKKVYPWVSTSTKVFVDYAA